MKGFIIIIIACLVRTMEMIGAGVANDNIVTDERMQLCDSLVYNSPVATALWPDFTTDSICKRRILNLI